MNRPSSEKYTLVARLLHWFVALGIIVAFVMALLIDDQPLLMKIKLINYHKWLGITVLALAIVRLVWRITHRPPAPPANMTKIEIGIAHAAHALLYLFMFSVPVCGWLFSSAAGFQVKWFGVIPLPDLVEKNKALAHTLHETHELGAWVLIIVAALHALAALKHHFVQKDNVLKRML